MYRITDEGRRQFAELLHSEQAGGNDDARNFSLRLAFARYLPPHARLRLLERRRGQLFQRLAEATSRGRRPPRDASTPTHARSWSTPPSPPSATSPGSTGSSRPSGPEGRGRDRRAGAMVRPWWADGTTVFRQFWKRETRHEHGTGRDRGRGELRQLARPGRGVLPRRRPRRHRAGADARHAGRLPRPRRRVRGRLRRGRGQGRRRPVQGDPGRPQQHHQVRHGRPSAT